MTGAGAFQHSCRPAAMIQHSMTANFCEHSKQALIALEAYLAEIRWQLCRTCLTWPRSHAQRQIRALERAQHKARLAVAYAFDFVELLAQQTLVVARVFDHHAQQIVVLA